MSLLDDAFKPRQPTPQPFTPADTGDGDSWAQAALYGECVAVMATGEGGRNARLNVAAVKVAGIVAGGYLNEQTAREQLAAAARNAGLDDHEIGATIASGFRHGLTTPRHKPALPDTDQEINTWLSSTSQPSTSPPAQPATLSDSSTGRTSSDDPADPEGDLVRQHLPLIDWHDLWADETREEWIVEPFLPARRLIALYSAPKVGKSLLLLELAVAIARGGNVLGVTVPRPYRVLYVDFENDPLGDVRTRLQNMHLEPDDLDNLCYLSFPTMAKLDTPQGAAQLLAAIKTYDCEVVVIDTVSRSIGGDENENDTWLAFYRETGLTLKQNKVAMIRLDHAGKDEAKGQRGASAKGGDVDAVWRMTRRTEDTFQLICEMSRFPIAAGDKVLTIQRLDDPLRHRVEVYGARGHVIDAVVDHLDDIDADLTIGYRAVWDSVKEAGIGASRQNMIDALKRRRELHGLTGEMTDDDQ